MRYYESEPETVKMINILNKYHLKGALPERAHNIMRSSFMALPPSSLSNPYSHMENTRAEFKVGSREEAVAAFRPWLKSRMKEGGPQWVELSRLVEVASAGDLNIVCCCVPLACHGGAVRDAIEWLIANPSWSPSRRQNR